MTVGMRLEDIQDLLDEIRHVVAAGLPLEHALADAAGSGGARLKSVAAAIAADLNQGHSLTDVIVRQSVGPSRMLAAAVAAGIRSGDAGITLELMGDLARDLIELRSRLLQASAYSLLIVMMAGLLLVTVVQHGLEQFLTMIDEWSLVVHPLLRWILQMNREYPLWVFVVPLGISVIVVLWLMTGRASSMAFRGPERVLLWLPGVRILLRDLQTYTLTRMLSLLIDQGLPLDEALLLAGGSSGAPALERGCRVLATRIQHEGRTGLRQDAAPGRAGAPVGRELPPLLFVCLTQLQDSGVRLVERLRSLSVFYRNRLDRNASWLTMLLPIVMFVVVGGGSALLYCGLVFWPVAEIYRTLVY